jgi:hypothetical protein
MLVRRDRARRRRRDHGVAAAIVRVALALVVELGHHRGAMRAVKHDVVRARDGVGGDAAPGVGQEHCREKSARLRGESPQRRLDLGQASAQQRGPRRRSAVNAANAANAAAAAAIGGTPDVIPDVFIVECPERGVEGAECAGAVGTEHGLDGWRRPDHAHFSVSFLFSFFFPFHREEKEKSRSPTIPLPA